MNESDVMGQGKHFAEKEQLCEASKQANSKKIGTAQRAECAQ